MTEFPELEGLSRQAGWRLVRIAREKHAAAGQGARAFRFGVVAFIWLIGLGTAVEVLTSAGGVENASAYALAALAIVVGTGAFGWATSAWLHRLWLRMKVAVLRESRGCYHCDYPLPTDMSREATCPECGLKNDLGERTWWRGRESGVARRPESS